MFLLAPQEELVSFRSRLSHVYTFVQVFSMCCVDDNVLSRVTPRYEGAVQCSNSVLRM